MRCEKRKLKVFNKNFPRQHWRLKGELCYKKITFQNVPSKAQIKNFFVS